MKSNLLSEEELSALSSGVQDGSIETDTGFNTRVRVRKHDLASEDSSLGVNVSSVDMINERFIRLFRLGLLEVLRTSPRVNPTRVQILKFGDYLKGLKVLKPEFRTDLAAKIKDVVNQILMKYEDFGGIEDVFFTSFVMQ